jgi:hypothetical protein
LTTHEDTIIDQLAQLPHLPMERGQEDAFDNYVSRRA